MAVCNFVCLGVAEKFVAYAWEQGSSAANELRRKLRQNYENARIYTIDWTYKISAINLKLSGKWAEAASIVCQFCIWKGVKITKYYEGVR